MSVLDTITTPNTEISRDRWGRPLVVPPTGGRPIAYTRCTTFVDCLEDKYNLQRWQQRMVAVGLNDRPDLLLAVAAHRDDKRKLDEICSSALEAAQASASATTGTALHALTEQHDRGNVLGPVPAAARADLDAYIAATRDMTHLGIETFVVHDGYKIGGTFDRLVEFAGKRYIADIKTGSVDYGMGKIAMQLAVYSRSVLYDHTTQQREPILDLERDRAIVIHLPAGTGTCRLLWVDIVAGWEAVALANAVRMWRTRKDLAEEITTVAVPPAPELPRTSSLLELIAATNTPDSLTALWRLHAHEWTDVHTQAAAERKRQLTEGAA